MPVSIVTGVPNVIEVPDTVPTTDIALFELLAVATTIFPLLESYTTSHSLPPLLYPFLAVNPVSTADPIVIVTLSDPPKEPTLALYLLLSLRSV